MIKFNKIYYIITNVSESTNNSRQLFKFGGNLLVKKNENPMPQSTSNNQLAVEFMEFFHTKIEGIREMFKRYGTISP